MGSRTLASYIYNANNGKLNTLTYGNGDKVKYFYDILDRIEEIWYNNGSGNDYIAYSYKYDTAGAISSVTDHLNGETTVYKYDASGKLMRSYVYDTETYTNLYGTHAFYDDQSRMSFMYHSYDYALSSGFAAGVINYSYSYDDITGNLDSLVVSSDRLSATITPEYDKLGRTSTKTSTFTVNNTSAFYNKLTFDYVTNNNYESVLVSQVVSQIGKSSSSTTSKTYNYTYDDNGNITQITNASGVVQNKYYYDALGQLIREDNRALNNTYTYSYDKAGNITAKKRYSFTTGSLGTVLTTINYTYGNSTWGDLLTSYGSTSISYDTIGNPTAIAYAELTWQGRELTNYYDGENYELSFGYNADGIRTYKEVYDASMGETLRHEYILNGSQIIGEAVYCVADDYEPEERYRIVYIYDETGSPIGMKYREPSYAAGVFDYYFFEKNLQGDIIAVYDANGTKLITYNYDAWGKCTTIYVAGYSACGGAIKNPFRYRGYYYDSAIDLYYLQSRYYNPEWGRFLNSDGQLSDGLFGYNLFAYCINNPIFFTDHEGNLPKWLVGGLAVLAGVAAFATVAATVPAAACFAGFAVAKLGVAAMVTAKVVTVAVGTAAAIGTGVYTADSFYTSQTDETVLKDAIGEDAYNAGAKFTTIATFGIVAAAAQGYEAGVCFIAGTLIQTEYGSVAIEDVEIGMLVYAHDPDTGETTLKEVVNTFVRESDELIHITVNGEHITTTPTHPFYVPQKGWTDAINLRAGDRLQLLNGEYVIVEQVQHELLETPVTVYNFEVEDFHTYYVTDSGVLVHNANCSGTKDAPRDGQSPNSVYNKIDGKGNIRSIAYYDYKGRQILRLDFDHFHAKTNPHIHVYSFNDEGKRNYNHVWDFNGNVVD